MMKVTVYSTPECPWCKKARELLKKNKVKFKDFNVIKDKKSREEMISKSHQMGVPVIIIDDKVIIGYDEKSILKAIKDG